MQPRSPRPSRAASTRCASTRTAPELHAALNPQGDLTARDRRLLVSGVALAHLLGLWVLLQGDSVRRAVREVAPMMVDVIAPPQPNQPPPPPPSAPREQPAPALSAPAPQPTLLAAPTPQAPTAETFSAPALPAAPAPEAVAVPASPAPPAPPATAPPPAPRKVINASAVRYLLEPPVEVPRASRRAGEHGVVWLRVVVGVQGLPLQVSVSRSSGHSRLDEQALWAMRQARFRPHTEDGRAIEVEVTAPIEYPHEW